MNVSIIIPNYNGAKLLEKNLEKVFDAVNYYKKDKMEVVIVDDASTDSSLDVIKNKNVVILKNEKNLGFSSTVNKGVKNAKGDIIVLLNTDVIPQKDFLEPLINHFNDELVFAAGCIDKSIEDGKVVLRGRGIGKWERGFLVHKRGEIDKTNTLWVTGGSGAFRKSIWNKLSGFNEIYNPFYWEDIDLSYRALKSGYKIIFESKSVVIHEHEKGAIIEKFSSFKIKTIAYRNQFIFVWENATDISLQFLHVLWLPYHFFKAMLRGDGSFFLGFVKAFISIPKIIKSSFKMHRDFVKTDYEIVKEFE